MLTELVEPGSRWTLVGGKGGVGKTTIACSLALSLADRGERTLVLSTDPAHSLGDALGVELDPEPRAVPGAPNLAAMELDAERERSRFLGRHHEALFTLLERGTYLTAPEVEEFLSLSLPGMDELAAMLCLMDLVRDTRFARVVVDTAPTGHTLRLLDAPRLLRNWLEALAALDARHHAVAVALAPGGAATNRRFLAEREAELQDLWRRIRDSKHTRFVLVTGTEPVVAAETRRYRAALASAGVALAGVVFNRVSAASKPSDLDVITRSLLGPGSDPAPVAYVPLLPEDLCGPAALRHLAALAQPTPSVPPPADVSAMRKSLRIGEPYLPPLDRRLYLVAGKGGVGKTTVASALAATLVDATEASVLLLSTDPAGSLADVWATQVGSEPRPAPGMERLQLRQLDAATAWDAFRSAYRRETERLFAGLLAPGLSAETERNAAERLVDLAPPGVDELMALLEVVDLLEVSTYNALVLDTAPTGHLLRLLEMPDVALDWAHAIMRLLLRLREAIGLGEMAERVLHFARQVRRLREQLRDERTTGMIVVALPEVLSVPETSRLLVRLRSLGFEPEALIVNRLFPNDGTLSEPRAAAAGALLQAVGAASAVGAPSWEHGPHGAHEVRRFAGAWRHVMRA